MELHKGGGSSTTVQSYEPTAEERRLWEIQGDYAEKMNPYVYKLADLSEGLLTDSFGANQYDFTSLNNTAQKQIANANNNLAGVTGSNSLGMASTNAALSGLGNQFTNASNIGNNALSQLSNGYGNAANTTNAYLASLAQGQLPSAYQNAMEKSIASGLQRTMGNNLNNLANRGVLNSSVTNQAMNDISRNAADTVAQQYQQNIGQVANLYNQQLGNTNNALGQQTNIANQQLANTNNALEQNTGILQNQLNNLLTTNTDNAGIYQQLLGNANAPITTAAAAQEAAQQPAMNLLNASLGTNAGSAGSALQALAGTGTTTSQQTMKQSGGLFNSLLGAGASVGSAMIACFSDNTDIEMFDGTTKKICVIRPGDMIIGYDLETDDFAPCKVVEVMKPTHSRVISIITDDNDYVFTTATQPLLTEDNEWIDVADIVVGTVLKNVGRVKGIVECGERLVYDIKVDGCGSYIANNFVAKGGTTEW